MKSFSRTNRKDYFMAVLIRKKDRQGKKSFQNDNISSEKK